MCLMCLKCPRTRRWPAGPCFYHFYGVKYRFSGEKYALTMFELRLEKERKAVLEGKLQSNIYEPDLVGASR